MQKTGVFLLAFLCAVSALPAQAAAPPPSASPSPTATWRFDNPFCEVLAALVPTSNGVAGTEYGLQLYASHGTRVAAHVTLIGATDAYDANVADTNLQGAGDDRRTAGVMVKFEKATRLHYFFVDSFSIDGGAPVTCPSYVFASGSGPADDTTMSGVAVGSLTPALLQALPDMPCGKAYTGPSIKKGWEPIVGNYGNLKRSTVLHVYIDSNGNALRSTLKQSSGVEGLDDAALSGVQWTTYHPAQFLCTPVVGEMDMEMEYSP